MVNDRARPTGWRRWVSGPRGTALSAALVAGILFGVAWLELGRWREDQRLQVLRGQVEVALGGRSSALASALGRRLALLDGLHAFVGLEAGSDRLARVFPDFASRLRGAVPGIRNLAVARGTVYVLVSPLAGNEKIIGYNLLADPRAEVREDTRRALDGPGPSLSCPHRTGPGRAGRHRPACRSTKRRRVGVGGGRPRHRPDPEGIGPRPTARRRVDRRAGSRRFGLLPGRPRRSRATRSSSSSTSRTAPGTSPHSHSEAGARR